MVLFDQIAYQTVVLLVGQVNFCLPQDALDLVFARLDILGAALLFKPRAYLVARFAGLYYFKPVAARAVAGLRGGDYLDYVARVYPVVYGHDLAVDLCTDHTVAHGRMYRIGEVDDRAADGQADNVALRRYAEDVLGRKVGLYRADYLLDVLDFLLVFKQLPYPRKPLLKAAVGG